MEKRAGQNQQSRLRTDCKPAGGTEITDATFEELEALMIQADLGVDTSEAILATLWDRERKEGLTKAHELRLAFAEELRKRLSTPPPLSFPVQPAIVLIVGVNGSGKTTTIAKLGRRFTDEGYKVLLGAADTYRAAAVDQLETGRSAWICPSSPGRWAAMPGLWPTIRCRQALPANRISS